MATPNNPPHGQVGDAAVDMRDEVEPSGTVPCAVHVDVLEIVTDQLSDLWLAVDVGQQLEVDVEFGNTLCDVIELGGGLTCL